MDAHPTQTLGRAEAGRDQDVGPAQAGRYHDVGPAQAGGYHNVAPAKGGRYCRPRSIAAVSFAVGLVTLLSTGGCRQGVPVIDTSPGPAEQNGTISGTVRGPEGTSAIEGRVVEVVNVETGERQRATTNNAGGFTIKVRPGKYRVELTLREGESIVKQPGVINVNRSDVDAHADFVVGTARISRPRPSQYRMDDGLGAPSA